MKQILYNDDCINIFKKLPDNSIDFVLTDPPYVLVNGGGTNNKNLKRKLHDNHIAFISDGFDTKTVFNEIERVCKIVNLVCFCSNKQISETMKFWEDRGYSTTLLIWQKPNPIPFGRGKYVSDIEFMVFVRGKNVVYNSIGVKEQSKVFKYPSPSKKHRIHPTEKPIALLERLLKIHMLPNDLVFDPFGGSFSTGMACKNLDRRFIGVEKDKEFYKQGKNRLEEQLF